MPQVFKPTQRPSQSSQSSLTNEDRAKYHEERKAALAAFGMHEVALTENQIRSIVAALGYYDRKVGVCTKAIQDQLGQIIGKPAIPKRDFQIQVFNSSGQCVLNIDRFPAYSEEDIEANELDTILAEHGFEGEIEYTITAVKAADAVQEDTSMPF